MAQGGAKNAKGKHNKENRNTSQAIKLRFEPSRFYVGKPKNWDVPNPKEEILSPYKIHDEFTSLSKPDPRKADMTATRPCYVRLERLSDWEKSTSSSCQDRL